jgi:hypothetical protein
MERAEDLGLSLSLSSSLAPRTHHVAMLLRAPGKCYFNYYDSLLALRQIPREIRDANAIPCARLLLREEISGDAAAPCEAQ